VTVTLHGMHYSVYVRVARLVLAEKGVAYDLAEINPFTPEVSPEHLKRHPFNRVPVLEHDGFSVYETAAITRYIDEAFDGPRLQANDPVARARMTQIIGIIDSYGYWPMVRQVFVERVSNPAQGRATDDAALATGLVGAERCCEVLEAIMETGPFLLGEQLTLADLHLAPMVDYFTRPPEGADCFARFNKLSKWWDMMSARPSLATTRPTRWD
jgi:glutathione S-transferase